METNEDKSQLAGSGSSARGAIIALVALLAVVLAGYLIYGQLTQAGAARDTQERAQAASSSTAGQLEGLPQLVDYDAAVYTEDGQPNYLTGIADGRPLVVNFWATWCPYCIQEMGDYQELYDEYSDRISFAFVDCVDGQRETVEDGASWLADNGYDLPAFYDIKQEAVAAFGAYSLPTTVIVDAAGNIMTISPGRISPDLMRQSLDSVLGE